MYITVNQLAEKINNLERFKPEEFCTGSVPKTETDDRYKQWIADVYHCSETWGQKMTEEEMLLDLTETEKQKDPGDYSPSPYLYRECCKYWNHLCDMYPN